LARDQRQNPAVPKSLKTNSLRGASQNNKRPRLIDFTLADSSSF